MKVDTHVTVDWGNFVADAWNVSTWEAEAGGFPQAQGQPPLHIE